MSLEVENQDSTVVWSGIPLVSLERVGLYSVCQGTKTKWILSLKLIQLTLKVINILNDLVCERLSELR